LVGRNSVRKNKILLRNQEVAGVALDGSMRFTVQQVGSHTVFCLANRPEEAEILADEVWMELEHFSPILRRKWPTLPAIEVVETGPVSILKEHQQTFLVPITVGWVLSQSWILTPQAPLLREVFTQERVS
jgi:hypothetical protein